MNLSELIAPIDSDMKAVNAAIRARLNSEVALIRAIGDYIVGAGGKRLRPALLLMVARALGYAEPAASSVMLSQEGGSHSQAGVTLAQEMVLSSQAEVSLHQPPHLLAAVVEFIHTATLLHDDVVDESALRRGRKTANAAFGNAASVLVGDYLYSRAFEMMVALGSVRIMEIFSQATTVIAEGEVLQLMNVHNPNISQASYLQVVRYKTAKLFEAAAQVAAVWMGASPAQEANMASYGRHLGTAFQLVDDVLDYSGATAALGKNVGDDLREGKPTLPLIRVMEVGTPAQRQLVRGAIETGCADFEAVARAISDTDALAHTLEAARTEARLAQEALTAAFAADPKLRVTPISVYQQSLLKFCAFAVSRDR